MEFFCTNDFNSRSGEVFSECFTRPNHTSKYILEGEILNRFLVIDTNNIESISIFLTFCGISIRHKNQLTDDAIKEYLSVWRTEQKEVINCIEAYKKITDIYTLDNYDIVTNPNDSPLKEEKQIERLRSPTTRGIANKLSQKLKDTSISFTTFPTKFPDAKLDKVRDKQMDKLHNFHKYKIVPTYKFDDNKPFLAVWSELASLLCKGNLYFKICPTCNSYFVKNGNRKVCIVCKIPPSKDKNNELQNLKNRVRKQRNRNAVTPEYIKKLFVEYKDNDIICSYLNGLKLD